MNDKQIKILFLSFFVVLSFILIAFLNFRTGVFGINKLDEKDSEFWIRDENNLVLKSEEIIFNGSKETCWLMIHGYSSGPYDLKNLGEEINKNFSDYVYIPRLKGHGEIPSHLLNLTLDDWYLQIENNFDSLSKNCSKINLVGFSFGGAIATRLAENKKVKNVYLISPYFFPKRNFIKIFDYSSYINYFANRFVYVHKLKIAQINSDELLDEYFSYWNFVLLPVKNSKKFLEDTFNDAEKIDSNILIQHSKKDDTADILGSEILFNKISSQVKEIIEFEKSNHVILFDYERQEVISNIIDFEKNHRELSF